MSITVVLRSGVFSKECILDSGCHSLAPLRQLARQFIEEKYPDGETGDALESHLLLFKHDSNSVNILQLIADPNDLTDRATVEVVVSPNQHSQRILVYPHLLFVHSYATPTFCYLCGEMLFGLVKQGLKCQACGLNYHKRCARKIPNNCSGCYRWKTRLFSLSRGASDQPMAVSKLPSTVGAHGPPSPSPDHAQMPSPGNTPEILITSADSARQLDAVSPVRWTLFWPRRREGLCFAVPGRHAPQGSQLQLVGTPNLDGTGGRQADEGAAHFPLAHVHQADRVPLLQEAAEGFCQAGFPVRRYVDRWVRRGHPGASSPLADCSYNCHKKCEQYVPNDCPGTPFESASTLGLGDESADVESPGSDRRSLPSSAAKKQVKEPVRHTSSAQDIGTYSSAVVGLSSRKPNIPLMRLVMTKRRTKASNKVLRRGWIVFHTAKNKLRRRHYWCLTPKSIVMYADETCTRRCREVPLSRVLAVHRNPSGSLLFTASTASDRRGLELRTVSTSYFVDFSYPNGSGGSSSELEWEKAIRQAWMPLSADAQKSHSNNLCQADSPETTCRSEDEFSQTYQVFMDDMIGSGQFGIVYSAIHRKSGRHVAVKIINKKKFPSNREAALRTEVNITQMLKHPGVVQFECVLETSSRIYITMEKLKGDMLEMILSSQKGRLNERITRFLVHQILVALNYLHGQNIVHCDLKPENILLVSDSDFPQVKLCDFGFARIIGERSFRRSIVGTPAYLAPEVLHNKGFNRSLDMWSVGVITYVALSGTFPFNEEEDILDQIKNASFLFPSHPWSDISDKAVEFVQNLLQVKISRRISVQKALIHDWLQSYQLWCDLRLLEKKLGCRYLTHESDDKRWAQETEAGDSASA